MSGGRVVHAEVAEPGRGRRGEWAGLARWLEATGDWHGDAPAGP